MRPEKRIDTFLKLLGKEWKKLGSRLSFSEFLFHSNIPKGTEVLDIFGDMGFLHKVLSDVDPTMMKTVDLSKRKVDKFMKLLGVAWKCQGVDLRFGQFMFNNGVQIFGGIEYHLEEHELLKQWFPDIDPAEYTYWGTYGKDGKSKLKYKLVKDLDTDHIEAILETQKRISPFLRGLLENELKKRMDASEVMKKAEE